MARRFGRIENHLVDEYLGRLWQGFALPAEYMNAGRPSNPQALIPSLSQLVLRDGPDDQDDPLPPRETPFGTPSPIATVGRITLRQPDAKFLPFPRLPIEIQTLIWDWAIRQLPGSIVTIGYGDTPEATDLNTERYICDSSLGEPSKLRRHLVDPSLAQACKHARDRFLKASLSEFADWKQWPNLKGVFLPQDSLHFDTGSHRFLGSPRVARITLRNVKEIMLSWQGLLSAPEGTPNMINMALFYWQRDLHEYRQCSIPTSKLKSIQIDYNCDDIEILLDQCPMPGCQCTSKMVSYATKLAARKHLQDDDLVAVVDLFDDARIQELTSLGSFSYEEETSFKWSRDQVPYTFIQYLQWKWTTVGKDAVTFQWVALQAVKSGKYLFSFVQPNLDDPDEWVTWDGLNLDNPWVKATVEAMPQLKPVIRLRLVTRHFENPNDEDARSD